MHLFMAMKQPPKILSLYHENAHHEDNPKFRAQRKIAGRIEIETAVILVGNDQEIAEKDAEQEDPCLPERLGPCLILIMIRAATVYRVPELIYPVRHFSLRHDGIAKRNIHDRHRKGASQCHSDK